MERLAVGDDTVEIEDDSSKHEKARGPEGGLLTDSFLEPFAGANRSLQTVFQRRVRAIEAGVVIAVRMIRAVEIEVVNTGCVAIEIEITASGIGFSAGGQI